MNKPLRRVSIAMMVMVVLLMGNATYIQVVKADEYRQDPHNTRMLYDEYSRARGQIMAGGQTLAGSQETSDRLKYLRNYPSGPAFAPVTGYYSFVYGSSGVEKAEDQVLNGSDDRLIVRRLSDLITGRDPRGGNVELTINPSMQQVAYNELTRRGFQGSVVAMNPKNGQILTMASAPSYDPNQLAGHDSSQQKKAWKKLNNDPAHPMVNRATSEVYPPGSTFKLVTAAAALSSGRFSPQSPLTGASSIKLPNTNTSLQNFEGESCGGGSTATMDKAMTLSCNAAFAQLAGKVGPEKLKEQAKKFDIGNQNLNVPMPVEPSSVGPMPSAASVYQSGIGQRDVRLTPLQNAEIVSAIANDGKLMKPNLVKKITAPDLSTLEQPKPKQLSQAMSPHVADQLTRMMTHVEQHSKLPGKLSGVSIASKTGTAEHGAHPKQTPPHGWYVAFGPTQDPQIAVSVVVENGGDRGTGATGAKIAGPIAHAVLRAGLSGGG